MNVKVNHVNMVVNALIKWIPSSVIVNKGILASNVKQVIRDWIPLNFLKLGEKWLIHDVSNSLWEG